MTNVPPRFGPLGAGDAVPGAVDDPAVGDATAAADCEAGVPPQAANSAGNESDAPPSAMPASNRRRVISRVKSSLRSEFLSIVALDP